MARRDPLAERIAAVEALREQGDGAVPALREALAAKEALVVAAAAVVVRDGELGLLAAEVAAALGRWLEAPAETDRGSRAKLALVEALLRCEQGDADPFLRAMRCVQHDPVWGASEDSAAPVRATAALGLARTRHRDALNELAALLVDGAAAARIGAAQAAGDLGDRAAVPLLRFKALSGDADPAVLQAVLGSLLHLAGDESLAFVARLLDHDDEGVADAAALALGESRHERALDHLARWSSEPEHARVGLVAVALLRSDRALAHLLDVLEQAEPRVAAAAVAALGAWRDDATLRRKVEERVSARKSAELGRAFAKAFPERQDDGAHGARARK